jgi:hypothetical protein
VSNPFVSPASRKISVPKFVRLVRILDRWVPTDHPTAIIPITSLRGFNGYKVRGTTYNIPWSVELYGGNCYIVKVEGFDSQRLSVPLHVLNYLRSHLNLR